jgi:hypothetical protein
MLADLLEVSPAGTLAQGLFFSRHASNSSFKSDLRADHDRCSEQGRHSSLELLLELDVQRRLPR